MTGHEWMNVYFRPSAWQGHNMDPPAPFFGLGPWTTYTQYAVYKWSMDRGSMDLTLVQWREAMWEFNQMPCLITQHPLHWLKSFSLHIPFNTLYFIHQRHFIYNAGSSCIQCYFFFMLLTALYKIPLLNDFRLFSLTPTIDDAQNPPAVKRVCTAKNTAMQLDEEEESKFKGGRLQVNYEFSNSPEESIASFLCISAMRHINRCKQ